jgi:hypothetical protein
MRAFGFAVLLGVAAGSPDPRQFRDAKGEFWHEYVDENTKQKYYYNPATEETTWDKPAATDDESSADASDLLYRRSDDPTSMEGGGGHHDSLSSAVVDDPALALRFVKPPFTSPFDDLECIKERENHKPHQEFGLEVLFISAGGVDAAKEETQTQITQVGISIAQ